MSTKITFQRLQYAEMEAGDAGTYCDGNNFNRNSRKAREMLDESTAEEYPPASVTRLEQWAQALYHPANLTQAHAHTLLSCMLSPSSHRLIL